MGTGTGTLTGTAAGGGGGNGTNQRGHGHGHAYGPGRAERNDPASLAPAPRAPHAWTLVRSPATVGSRTAMGKRAATHRRATQRSIRDVPLSLNERANLRANAGYEGSPHHKRNPGDFGLTPPSAPRPDKTLCDEAQVFQVGVATALFAAAIDAGIASEGTGAPGFPKQLWAVDPSGQVFDAMYGGSRVGRYHGYPIRRADPLFDEVVDAWNRRNG